MDTEIGSARNRIYQVTELAPATLLEIAERLDEATSFEDQIYRESEIDALWTLVDIQVRQAELAGDPSGLARWRSLHSRLWEAHDLIPDGRCPEAAAILRELAAGL
ncbi:hypothetical protein [Nocardioides sp. Iso805N]|uniref:hypothetical protein n=1 Tax=Nocardioides sp. Iso805N TaxID=1283287 RepID=UPI00037EA170|nr:hypothetical protein [Nocardioides sp. Iso805N]